MQFITSWYTAIDILSILPISTLPVLYAGNTGPTLQFLRILRLFRAFRLLDINTTGGLSDATIRRQVREQELPIDSRTLARPPWLSAAAQAALLVCTVATYVLTGAGLVHAFDRQWPGSFITVNAESTCDFK